MCSNVRRTLSLSMSEFESVDAIRDLRRTIDKLKFVGHSTHITPPEDEICIQTNKLEPIQIVTG
jgi:hypothetical protein